MLSAERRAAAQTKLDKAAEFLLSAELIREAECFDAAVSLAVSAAINASDAAIVLCGGQIPRGSSHDAAVTVLRKSVDEVAARQLARVLSFKNKAQYDVKRCTRADAEDAIRAAERVLSKSKGLVE